jgi:hypothetical protein
VLLGCLPAGCAPPHNCACSLLQAAPLLRRKDMRLAMHHHTSYPATGGAAAVVDQQRRLTFPSKSTPWNVAGAQGATARGREHCCYPKPRQLWAAAAAAAQGKHSAHGHGNCTGGRLPEPRQMATANTDNTRSTEDSGTTPAAGMCSCTKQHGLLLWVNSGTLCANTYHFPRPQLCSAAGQIGLPTSPARHGVHAVPQV